MPKSYWHTSLTWQHTVRTISDGDGWQKVWAGTVSAVLVGPVGAMIYLGAGLNERMGRKHAEIRAELTAIRGAIAELSERVRALEVKGDLDRGPNQL